MKKYLAMVLCLLVLVSCFTGCGKKEDEVDLVVWTKYAEGTPAYDVAVEKIKAFEEAYDVNLEVMHYGSDITTILGTALDAGERVDVFPLGSTIQLKANIDHCMDITEYYNNSDMEKRAYPIHMEIIKQQHETGAITAIPTLSSFQAFWYNAEAFEKAGINENPETIEEFEAVCDALVAAGYSPIALDAGYAISTLGALVERMVGEKVVGEMVFNGGFAENERFVAACQKVIDWRNAGYFDPSAPCEWPASQNKIGLTGENVMVYTGMWASGEIEEMTGADLEWGSFKFPYDPTCEDGTYGAAVSCTCNCINVNCENPDLAWEYLYYMNTGEVNKAITDADVYLVDDMTMEPLPQFADAKVAMETTTDVVNYAGGLHDNADIKTAVSDLAVKLFAGDFKTGLEAAEAFDALVG